MPYVSTLIAGAAMVVVVCATPVAAQSPGPMPTKDLVQAAVSSDQFEILEAQDALAQSQSPIVRAFAQEMVRDHTADSQVFQQAAEKAGVPSPTKSLSGDQSQMLGALQSQRGAAFDQAYAKQQVLGHTQALIVQRAYAGGGSDPDVRQASQAAVPLIQHHFEMAEQLRASLDRDR